jgi:hypothetical protein
MKSIARSLIVVLVALVAVPALVVTATITTAVQLLATTALIMGGTEHPLSSTGDTDDFVNNYFFQATDHFIRPGLNQPSEPIDTYAVTYPAEFFPVFGTTTFDSSVSQGRTNLGHCLGVAAGTCGYNQSDGVDTPDAAPPLPGGPDKIIVFGYSQSAVVASLAKQDLVDKYSANPDDAPDVDFVLVSNPMRPNGGILGRGFEGMTIPLIGITFYGATPTCADGGPCFDTVDVAHQYDLLGGDAPAVVWNVLAWGNSAAAYYYLHGDVPSQSLDDAISQGTVGDTDYFMLTSERLPILLPLQQVGVPDALLAVADAPLRVLIESAYYRDTSPGESVSFQLLPQKDLGTLAVNLLASVPVGIDDGLQEAGVGRALGTNDVYRPFGVGGQTYEKGTVTPAGVETGGNVFTAPPAPDLVGTQSSRIGQPQPLTTASGPSSDGAVQPGVNKDSQTELANNVVTQQPDTTPEVTRPRPLQIVRDSLNFDPSKRPAATQPSGNGPLRQIVKALTGQKPNTTANEANTGANNEASDDAA